MSTPVFYNRDGSLTAYALACGYVELFTNNHGAWIRLEKDSPVYAVKGTIGNGFANLWETFDTLAEARKFYRSQIRLAKVHAEAWG